MENDMKLTPVFMNGVSVSCIHDYTTKTGDKDTFMRISVPVQGDDWGSLIVPKAAIKDSKNPDYKNVMLFDKKSYPFMVDGSHKLVQGEDIVHEFDEARSEYQEELQDNMRRESRILDNAFKDAMAKDDGFEL